MKQPTTGFSVGIIITSGSRRYNLTLFFKKIIKKIKTRTCRTLMSAAGRTNLKFFIKVKLNLGKSELLLTYTSEIGAHPLQCERCLYRERGN